MAKSILCYGDSNTWGYVPLPLGDERTLRLEREQRWTGRLAALLGAGWEVAEAGLSGRNTGYDDPDDGKTLNGLRTLECCLRSAAPCDVVVLMLGTNDTKPCFGATPQAMLQNMECMVSVIREDGDNAGRGKPPAILLVSPIAIDGSRLATPEKGGSFGPGSPALLEATRPGMQALAARLGLGYLDASAYAAPSPHDGLHMDAGGHRVLAGAVYRAVLQLL